MVIVAKDTQYYSGWTPDNGETATQRQTREKRHEKPYTHNMTKALAQSFKTYKEQLKITLANDAEIQVICKKLNITSADLIRYLLIRASHMDRVFIGDSKDSDGGVVENMNKHTSAPHTEYIKVEYKNNDLKKRLQQ